MTHPHRRRPRRPIGAAIAAAGAAVASAALWGCYRQPIGIVRWLENRSDGVLYRVDTPEPLAAITIDDGPDPRGMPRILDVLGQHGAHATFFLIGDQVRGREDLVRRAADDGHEIANHTSTDRASILLGMAEFERDLLRADAVLRPFGLSHWFRPGSGFHHRRMVAIARRHGYRTVIGSVYPWDPHVPSVAFAVHKIAAHTRPGSIVILHDGSSRGPRTAAVLGRVLPILNGRGLRFVTLSDLVAAGESRGRAVARRPSA